LTLSVVAPMKPLLIWLSSNQSSANENVPESSGLSARISVASAQELNQS
jgi:hypothetical protein